MQSADVCRQELRASFAELRSRCLHQAAKWASEQIVGLPDETDGTMAIYAGADPSRARVPLTPLDEADNDSYLLAVSYFEGKEYARCIRVLSSSRGPRASFLSLYARYLLGEKRKEEDRLEATGPLGRPQGSNTELGAVESGCRSALASLKRQGVGEDPFLLFLRGLVLSDMQRGEEAAQCLSRSLQLYPCNWQAWQALILLCPSPAALPVLPDHWTRSCFEAALCLELQLGSEALDRLQEVLQLFPRSNTALLQAATAQYNLRNYAEAQQLFEDLSDRDPDAVDGMDIYSNILYVQEAFGPLSSLAHRMTQTDKYRPETCCVVGNYYSLRNLHEKAVLYFQRALKLSPHYLSAWTLMGHEYVEMKNPSAAIDCYRRAVDINPRDYRAWYGLGQTYELLLQPYYALYYFRRAAQLRPHDPRMWCALGQCYESSRLAMYPEAIRCYRQAVVHQDPEGIALLKLARLHEQLGGREEAAHYFQQTLERSQRAAHPLSSLPDPSSALSEEAVEACVFLAQYCRDTLRLEEAESYCQRLLDTGGVAKERAKALLREIRALQAGPLLGRGAVTVPGPGPSTPIFGGGGLPLLGAAAMAPQQRPGTSHGFAATATLGAGAGGGGGLGLGAQGLASNAGFPGFRTPAVAGMTGAAPQEDDAGGDHEMEEGSDLELSD